MAHLVLLLPFSSKTCSDDVPVYPGATFSAAMSNALQDRNPDSGVYTTPDDFDRVHAFYRKVGCEAPIGTVLTDGVKHASFRFPGKSCCASISWRQRDATSKTVITLGTLNGQGPNKRMRLCATPNSRRTA